MLLTASRIVTSECVHSPGWVRIAGDTIVAVGSGDAPAGDWDRRDFGDATLVPGFVDAHVHGGGGASYTDVAPGEPLEPKPAHLERFDERDGGLCERSPALVAREAHLAHGTTTTMASLVTASPAKLLAQVLALAPLVTDGTLCGIHLEGPWLSPARKGAHDERALRAPDATEIDALLRAARGAIRMVTIAPELPGALAAIERFGAAGVTVAIGHTDADFEQTRRAIDAGATVATHLFNAMPPLLHRAPGPVLALLEDERVTLELVADGVHLHRDLVRLVERAAGADRVMLVTDAMGAAACGDGDYRLGALAVEVRDGVATLAGTETIAGSTCTMDALFRGRAVAGSEISPPDAAPAAGLEGTRNFSEASLVAAVRMTSTNPARALGLGDVGDIAVGRRADFVVFDDDLRLREVILAANTVEPATELR